MRTKLTLNPDKKRKRGFGTIITKASKRVYQWLQWSVQAGRWCLFIFDVCIATTATLTVILVDKQIATPPMCATTATAQGLSGGVSNDTV